MVIRWPLPIDGLVRWLEALLVLLIAWVVAGMLTRGTPSPGEHALSSPGVDGSAVDIGTRIDTERIVRTALFGKAEKKAKPDEAAPAPVAPETVAPRPSLRIRLLGTVVAEEASLAILRVGDDSKEKIVSLHEAVADGVVLTQVFPDAIEVLDHGHTRRIALRKDENEGAEDKPATMPTPKPKVTSMPNQSASLHRSIERRAIQRATRNFSQLLTQAKVVPRFRNGKADGFVIDQIVPRSLFQKIGLRNGDVIVSVNQQKITNAAQAMRLYRELQSAAEIQLEIERAGQLQRITYHIH